MTKFLKSININFFLGRNKNNWQNSVESNKSTKGKIGPVSSFFLMISSANYHLICPLITSTIIFIYCI